MAKVIPDRPHKPQVKTSVMHSTTTNNSINVKTKTDREKVYHLV